MTILLNIKFKGKTPDGRTIYDYHYDDGTVQERIIPKEVHAAMNKIMQGATEVDFKNAVKWIAEGSKDGEGK